MDTELRMCILIVQHGRYFQRTLDRIVFVYKVCKNSEDLQNKREDRMFGVLIVMCFSNARSRVPSRKMYKEPFNYDLIYLLREEDVHVAYLNEELRLSRGIVIKNT